MRLKAAKTLVLRLPKGYQLDLPKLAPGYFYMLEDHGEYVEVYYRKKEKVSQDET